MSLRKPITPITAPARRFAAHRHAAVGRRPLDQWIVWSPVRVTGKGRGELRVVALRPGHPDRLNQTPI
jgi:hypothetical protein